MLGIILLTSIATTQTLAEESDLYVGLDIVGSSNTFTRKVGNVSVDADNDSSGFKLKFGTVQNEGWRVQGYYLHETYDKPVFLLDNESDVLNEFGLDIIKGFEVTPKFSPFIQAGLGFGSMKVQGYDRSSANEVSFKLGAGLMYKVTPAFELLAGIDFQGRSWSDIIVGPVTLETSESSSKLYLGANLHF